MVRERHPIGQRGTGPGQGNAGPLVGKLCGKALGISGEQAVPSSGWHALPVPQWGLGLGGGGRCALGPSPGQMSELSGLGMQGFFAFCIFGIGFS